MMHGVGEGDSSSAARRMDEGLDQDGSGTEQDPSTPPRHASDKPFALDGIVPWAQRSAKQTSAEAKPSDDGPPAEGVKPASTRFHAVDDVDPSSVALNARKREHKPFTVRTPDGVTISAQEWGNPNGLEIVFIHGYLQASSSWTPQVQSDLAKEFRMIAYDLRGHGDSDKPLEPEKYRESTYWADELKAVIDAANLKRPVLVGWSYGGRIIADYIRIHGAARLAGLNYVAAVTKTDPGFFGPPRPLSASMESDDLAANTAATREFLRYCFEKQPEPGEFEKMLAVSMKVPAQVRANTGGRQLDIDDILRELELPVLVTQGEKDRVILTSMSEHTAETIPGAKLSLYPGIGHSPFHEAASRFNAELADFVREASRGSKGT